MSWCAMPGAARSHWYYAGDTLLSVDAMNDPRAYMVGKRLIEMGKSPSREAVADPRPTSRRCCAHEGRLRIVAGRWRGKTLADVGRAIPRPICGPPRTGCAKACSTS
jgi:hypothetical protein